MIDEIIDRAVKGEQVGVDDVYELMSISDPRELDALYEAARRVRDTKFGKKVFTYGFVYFSTYCKNNCAFCYFRRSNNEIERYRKDREEIVQLAGSLKDAGINLADLTMGEDPRMYADDYKLLLELVSAVHDEVGINIMASPGALPREMFPRLREAGADWHACYQETHDRTLFAALRVGQDFDRRCQARRDAAAAGLLVEDGLLTGVGENAAQLAHSLQSMYGEPLSQVRAMSYVPHACTLPPQAGDSLAARRAHELRALAAMRLLMPDRLVPASLDVDGLDGLTMRLQAGANVVTSLVPSGRGFAGVASRELDIDNERRGVAAVRTVLDRLGLEAASPGDYARWLTERRRTLTPDAGERTGGTCG